MGFIEAFALRLALFLSASFLLASFRVLFLLPLVLLLFAASSRYAYGQFSPNYTH